MVRKDNGFTLLEVLVAAFILFLVITAMTLVYRGAVLTSNKAERSLHFSALVTPICEQIRAQIRNSADQNKLEGEGVMGDVSFSWAAREDETSTEPDYFDPDHGDYIAGSRKFTLWTIHVVVKNGTASRQYEFSEMTW